VGFEGVAEPRGNRREAAQKQELRELTDEEMIKTYDELEREMYEIRSKLEKRGESSDTEAINAWRTRTKDVKEKRTGDIEERALQLAIAAERIREKTYAGARAIEIAPIREVGAEKQGSLTERVETTERSSSINKKNSSEKKKVKIEDNKSKPEQEERTAKTEKRIKTEKMETSDDSGKSRHRDRMSSSSKSAGRARDVSSTEEPSEKDDHSKKRSSHRGKSRERSRKNRDRSESGSESGSDDLRKKHKNVEEARKGKNKTAKRRCLDFVSDESSEEDKGRTRKNQKR